MKRLLIFVGLITTALIVFVWQLPASVIAGFIPPEANRVLQVHQITGTLWQGRSLFTTVGVAPTLSLSWRCQPSRQ